MLKLLIDSYSCSYYLQVQTKEFRGPEKKQCLSKIVINNQSFSEVFNFIQIQLDIHYLLALNLA